MKLKNFINKSAASLTLALVVVPTPKGSERRLYLRNFFQSWNKSVADVENLANARIPPHRLDGVPEYIICDQKNPKMLWDVMQMIEERQATPAPKPPASTPQPKAN